MLHLEQIVVVGLLVHLQLSFVLCLGIAGFFQLQGIFGGRVAIAGSQERLGLGLEVGGILAVAFDLPRHALDQSAILFQAFAAFAQLVHSLVVFVLQLRHRVGGPGGIRDFVHLGLERLPELAEDHGKLRVSGAELQADTINFPVLACNGLGAGK